MPEESGLAHGTSKPQEEEVSKVASIMEALSNNSDLNSHTRESLAKAVKYLKQYAKTLEDPVKKARQAKLAKMQELLIKLNSIQPDIADPILNNMLDELNNGIKANNTIRGD